MRLFPSARVEAPDQRAGGWVFLLIGEARRVPFALGRLAHGLQELLQRVVAVLGAAHGVVEGAAELVVHLLRQVRQQVAQVGQGEACPRATRNLVGREDAHARLVVPRGELGQVLHLLQRAVLGVGVHDEHGGPVVGHEQLFQQHAGQVALAAAGAGDDGQVRAGEAAHVQRHGHGAVGPGEQAAQVGAAAGALAPLAEDLGQEVVPGDVDGRAAGRRHPRVDEVPQALVVVAQHGHGDLEELAGVAVVAQERGDIRRRDGRVGHEAVGEELDGAAAGDAAQDGAVRAVDGGQVEDELAVLDPALRVRGEEGVFVGRLARPLDGADAGVRRSRTFTQWPLPSSVPLSGSSSSLLYSGQLCRVSGSKSASLGQTRVWNSGSSEPC